jgi:alkanesulfonate monooxygenase SsuD/methylene tetrahydromethanopterin reductase-like flavin-dependent oxidoreductase (luciferase family)
VDRDRAFYAEVKEIAARNGRDPEHLVVLPGLYAVVGDTETEARKRKAEFDDLMETRFLVRNLANSLGIPADKLDPNRELPYALFEDHPTDDEVITYRRNDIGGVSRANGFTVKQLVHHNLTRGQRALFGTPEQIADTIIEWRDTGVSDGFNVNVDVQFDGMDRFRHVITELQNRGRFRKEYEHDSFRRNYGLPSAADS